MMDGVSSELAMVGPWLSTPTTPPVFTPASSFCKMVEVPRRSLVRLSSPGIGSKAACCAAVFPVRLNKVVSSTLLASGGADALCVTSGAAGRSDVK